MTWARRRGAATRFHISSWQDAPDPPMDAALRRGAERAVQVVTPRGERLEAGRAVLYVLECVGRERAARFLSRRPWIWGVEGTYRLIARSRSFLERFASREPRLCRAEDASENADGGPFPRRAAVTRPGT